MQRSQDWLLGVNIMIKFFTILPIHCWKAVFLKNNYYGHFLHDGLYFESILCYLFINCRIWSYRRQQNEWNHWPLESFKLSALKCWRKKLALAANFKTLQSQELHICTYVRPKYVRGSLKETAEASKDRFQRRNRGLKIKNLLKIILEVLPYLFIYNWK
jgi:hypothetical protein